MASFAAHGHPSDRVLRAMVSALESAGVATVSQSELVGKVLLRLGWVPRGTRGGGILLPMMGQQWWRLARAAALGNCVVYAWDVWQPDVPVWRDQLERRHVRAVITSSSQAAEALREAGLRAEVGYLPEAVDSSRFPGRRPLVERTIDCLEVGRRDDRWHARVAPGLARAGYQHLYEARRGQLVFPTDKQLDQGFMNAKVLICLPRSHTHPDSAGDFDVLTQRYLEGMAAGCVLLGEAPSDLVRLFGYNPVIPLDEERPLQQVTELLGNIANYQWWVDRNRDTTFRVGSWNSRVSELIARVNAAFAGDAPAAPNAY